MRLTLIALLTLGACSSQPPAPEGNVVQAEVTNVTDDASPAPLDKAPIAAEPSGNVRFRCMDGVRIAARFAAGKVAVTRDGRTIVLPQQRMGSGIRYSDGKTSFQGKGDAMSFEAPGQPPIACTVIR
jgi:membrane-bound inhibitor of C-type lysozyme